MYSFRSETRELTDEVRRRTGGSFLELPDGVTHYELANPGGQQTVVLVHGFSVPCFIFDPTFPFLARHGLCVLRYDLLGRGLSDRPPARYDVDLFVKQLATLLDALGQTRPVSLVGLSMGGPISAAFTARHPGRVEKLVLIDPAGAGPVSFARLIKAATLPVAGERLLDLLGEGRKLTTLAAGLFDRKLVDHFEARYRVQMQYKGFRRALLSTVRGGMLDSFLDTYRAVGRLHKPCLLIWGRHDRAVPLRHSRALLAAIPEGELHVLEDCSHLPHYEKPEETNALLLEFLRRP